MLVSKILDDTTVWVQEKICNEMNLMKPDENNMGRDYKPEPVKPTAFPLYIPAKEFLPPNKKTKLPAVCVQFMGGTDDLQRNEMTFNIRLAFAVWAPCDWPPLKEDVPDPRPENKRSANGWREVMRFVEKALRVVESEVYIAGMKIDKSIPVKYGFFDQNDTMVNAYPEWYAYMTFNLKSGIAARLNYQYQDFL